MYSDKLNSDISSQSWVKTGNADQETICEPQQSTKKKTGEAQKSFIHIFFKS